MYYLNVVLNQEDDKKVKILLGEVKALQKDLEEIVHKIFVVYNGTHPVYETIEHEDTTQLLDDTIKWLYKE